MKYALTFICSVLLIMLLIHLSQFREISDYQYHRLSQEKFDSRVQELIQAICKDGKITEMEYTELYQTQRQLIIADGKVRAFDSLMRAEK